MMLLAVSFFGIILNWMIFTALGRCTIDSNENLRTIPSENAEEVIVSFQNKGDADLVSYWINPTSEENSFGEIPAGHTVTYNTFVGHAWRLTTKHSNEVIFETVIKLSYSPKVLLKVGEGCTNERFIDEDDDDEEMENQSDYDNNEEEEIQEEKEIEEKEFLSDDYHILDSSDQKAIFKVSKQFQRINMPPSDEQLLKSISKSPCMNAEFDLDLLRWISRVLVVPGYHILCISPQDIEVEVKNEDEGEDKSHIEPTHILEIDAWINGHNHINNNTRQSFIGSDMNSLRKYLEVLINIQRTDSWHERTALRQKQRMADNDSSKEYMPQKWQIYSEDGHVITSMNEIYPYDAQIILLFEGGQFIYPGIDVGYIREINTGELQLELETLSLRPLVFGINSFLTKREYEYIIKKATPKMYKSQVSFMDKDQGRDDRDFRTSSTYFMPSENDPFLINIDKRAANLTRTSRANQEYVQVLQYNKGEYYGQHTDFWDIKYYSDINILNDIQGGHANRLLTLFWYMSSCDGGFTAFPDAPTERLLLSPSLQYTSRLDDEKCPHAFKIKPKPGSAILFYSLLPDGSGDWFSSHAACPVKSGTKWAANKWIWNTKRQFIDEAEPTLNLLIHSAEDVDLNETENDYYPDNETGRKFRTTITEIQSTLETNLTKYWLKAMAFEPLKVQAND
eukprot:gene4129-8206_t